MDAIEKRPSVWQLLRESGFILLSAVATVLGIVYTLISQNTWQEKSIALGAIILLAFIILHFIYCTQYRVQSRDWKMFFKNDSDLHRENISNESYPKLENLVTHPDVCCALLTPEMRKNTHIVQIGFVIIGKMDTDSQEKGILLIERKGSHHWYGKHKESILVSFSPFPARYEEKFDILSIYAREIPSAYAVTPKITPLCVHPPAVWQGEDCTHLFYIYTAEYEEVFTEDNLKKLFCIGGHPFVKDHDGIKNICPHGEIARLDKENKLQGNADTTATNALHKYFH